MPQDVGDAVLHFLGDSTQLNETFDSVAATAETKLAPVNAQLEQVQGNWLGAGEAAKVAGTNSLLAGDEMVVAAEEVKVNMREAKGEIALLGEETGIRLPRHVRSFVAELPGVGQALEAAFSATAVLILVQILIEGTKRLSEWVDNTFIMTEAMKANNEAIIKQNGVLVELVAQYTAAKKQVEEFGKTPLELAALNVENLTKKLAEQKQEFINNEQVQAAYRRGLDDVTQDMSNRAGAANIQINASLKLLQVQLDLAELERQRQENEAYNKRIESIISAEKTIGEAKIKLVEANHLAEVSLLKNNFVQAAQIRAQAADEEYNLSVSTLQKKIALAERDPEKNANQLRQMNAELEAIEKEHATKVVTAYAGLQEKLKEIRAQAIEALTDAKVGDDPDIKRFEKAAQAAQALGIAFSADLGRGVDEATKAYKALQSTGIATDRDLLAGQIKVTEAQIEYNKAIGVAPKVVLDQVAALQKLEKTYNDLYKGETKSKGFWDVFSNDIVKKSHDVGNAAGQMGRLTAGALNEMSKGFESAVAAAILGGGDIVNALEKSTASTLANLAAQSAVYALYYTAMGIAELATGVTSSSAGEWFAAAGLMAGVAGVAGGAAIGLNAAAGGSGGGGNGAPGQGGPAFGGAQSSAGTSTGPVQTTNVQKFAAGGLITGPTLAQLGEQSATSREAAIPLDNPRAIDPIVEALTAKMHEHSGGGGHVIVNGLISADNLHRLVRQINKGTKGRKLDLQASNSYRVTKRSA